MSYTTQKTAEKLLGSSLEHDEDAGQHGLPRGGEKKRNVQLCRTEGLYSDQLCFRKDRLSFSAILASTLAAHRILL